ncbi:MAG: hypothetical protein H6714_09715 [Myxococcales bacterium]|nr:hypothetical protein [Myxococcales bacterium]
MTEPPLPPSTPPSDPWHSPVAPAPAESPLKTGLKRTWVVVLLSVLGSLCVLSTICFVSCGLLFKKGKQESSAQLVIRLKEAAALHPNGTQYMKDINQFAAHIKNDDLDFTEFARVLGRVQAADADKTIDAREMDSLMILVRDVNRRSQVHQDQD